MQSVPDGAAVPAAPVVRPEEIWPGVPNVLVDGGHYTIGWQGWPERKGGPGFVTVRRNSVGTLKVVERFPLTDEGWVQAWQSLARLDPGMPSQVIPVLAGRAEADWSYNERGKLDARSLACLPHVIFVGGYLRAPGLAAGQTYDLRFLEDRLSVFPQDSPETVAEFSYAAVETVEVAGPGLVQNWAPGQVAILTAALGVAGALAAYGSTRVKTYVRVQTAQVELFFLHTSLLPDDLRIRLSPALGAIREARSAAAGPADGGHQPGSASLVDELTRLGKLLDSGLLTRAEFDQLKARLIDGH